MIDEFKQWKSGTGKLCNITEVINRIKNLTPVDIHIGSDSKITKSNVTFATAICLLDPGNGGIYFIHEIKNPIKKSFYNLQVRLFQEVNMSIAIAKEIENKTGQSVLIHIDANQQLIHKSAKYAKNLANYVVSMGFKYILKPGSWASANVADRYTK